MTGRQNVLSYNMKKMKYIVVDDGLGECPYIFPNHVEHYRMLSNVGGELISAGFVVLTYDGLECYGESVGLKVESRPEIDTKLLKSLIGGLG